MNTPLKFDAHAHSLLLFFFIHEVSNMAEDRERRNSGDSQSPDGADEPVENGPVDDEPNFSDPEDFVDDITDEGWFKV